MGGDTKLKINKNKLGIAMARKGMSFKELAERSCISRTTLSYINNGKSCRPEVVSKIAVALNVDVIELIEE